MAQSGPANLAALERQMPSDTAAISQGLVLTEKLIRTDPKAAGKALERIREFAQQNDHYPALVTYAAQLTKLARNTSEQQKSIEILEELLNKHGDDLTEIQELAIRLWLAEGLEAMPGNFRANAMVKELSGRVKLPVQQAQLSFIRANVLTADASYPAATGEYLKALKYYRSTADLDRLIRIYSNLAGISTSLEDFTKAIEYYQNAVKYALQEGDPSRLGPLYSSLGTVYRRTERYPQALEYYQKALSLDRGLENPLIRAQNLMNIGMVYDKTKQYDEALRYFEESLKLSRRHGLKNIIALSYINRATVYSNVGQYRQATLLLDSALVLTRQLGQPHEKSLVYERYSRMYERQGKSALSLAYFKRFKVLRDSVFILGKQKQVSELMGKFEMEQKNAEMALQELGLKTDRIRDYMLFGLLVLFLLGIAGFWRLTSTRNRCHRLLYEKHTRLMDARVPVVPKLARLPNSEDEQLEALYDRIVALFDHKKPFRDPRFSVLQLAQQLSSNERVVSSAIRLGCGLNFNSFVNIYRIHEASRLFRDMGPAANVELVMEKCGFKARRSFYSVFAAQTGLTPGQFLRKSARGR
jgi:tetratricopeptide (TPR) repeat protein